jgi:ferritin-like metal-binding protein YciE
VSAGRDVFEGVPERILKGDARLMARDYDRSLYDCRFHRPRCHEAARGKTCDAIMGIIEEGQEVMKEYKGTPALDAGLLAAAQAVEHDEMSRYGTLRTWAQELGFDQSVKFLDAALVEEKKTDEALTQLAESNVNQHAAAA